MKENKKYNRRRFLYTGAGLAAALGFLSLPQLFRRNKKTNNTVKMLAQDGSLVEVDASRISGQSHKATVEELQQWVRR